ncbi:MAG: 3-oxoacid CoA-transferase subunit A [Hyphomonadaceae bacterium]|nr:MAG: 3-oxoacid CoA-transferase subunit A [Hyphomonadaceae bacterium]KAF0186335.1 MAG: 3-oxoacid CoA-transferase subunit A [Hyphomonadaceae bacterium]
MDKIYPSAQAALDGLIFNGARIMIGGFGFAGLPEDLIDALAKTNARQLTIIICDAGGNGAVLEKLFENRQVSKLITSYVGSDDMISARYLDGEFEVEFVPQGTLAEAIRCGGAGIPAFYTKTGVHTVVAAGKEHKLFAGIEYIMETAIRADIALIHAETADFEGNLTYKKTARNFNPIMATAATHTIVEVEKLVATGEIDPDNVHTPGIYVDRIIQSIIPKHIEHLKVRNV